jgi:nitrate/TMAO reductase-like tetraheme cytochrome c subunit
MTKAGLVVSATCNDCHGAHLILPPDSAESTINRANIAETCGKCHAGVLETFDQSSHGKAARTGARTPSGHSAPVCVDCHPAHQLVSASDPVWFRGVVKECGSCHEHEYETYFETYHGQNLVATCGACHPNANANFVKYQPHGDPKNRSMFPRLFWTWLFMTTLLVSVFLFFGAHTLLWLGRLIIDRLRGRTNHDAHPPGTSGPGPQEGQP